MYVGVKQALLERTKAGQPPYFKACFYVYKHETWSETALKYQQSKYETSIII
jgi:hypothetical protein